MADENEKPDTDSNTARPQPKRGFTPTKSMLSDAAWKAEIKKSIGNKSLDHEYQLGPYFRPSAPYRAKMAPPFEKGPTLIIKGRVWSTQEKSGIEATMHVWHANAAGKYDNEDSEGSQADLPFINRARVHCDDNGFFEFETIYPGGYRRNNIWRAPHIHFYVEYPGHIPCVIQTYFRDDPYLEADPLVDGSEVIVLTEKERNGLKYKEGELEIVLAAERHEPD